MWFVHTIICIYNISIVPFCAYDGKLPIKFEDLKSCDIFIDDIIETINDDLIEKEIGLLMKCMKDYEQIDT